MAKALTTKSLLNRLRKLQDKGGDLIEKLAQWADEYDDEEFSALIENICANLNLVFYESPKNGSGIADAIEFVDNVLLTDEDRRDDFDD